MSGSVRDVGDLSGTSGICQGRRGPLRAVGGLSGTSEVCQGRRGPVRAVAGLSGPSGVCQGSWGSVSSFVSLLGFLILIETRRPLLSAKKKALAGVEPLISALKFKRLTPTDLQFFVSSL